MLRPAKRVMWEPIRDKCAIPPGRHSRRPAFEEVFDCGVKSIFHYLSLGERVELLPLLLANVYQVWRSTRGLDGEPRRDLITPEELGEVERYARELGGLLNRLLWG